MTLRSSILGAMALACLALGASGAQAACTPTTTPNTSGVTANSQLELLQELCARATTPPGVGASENHIGEVGGNAAALTVAQTVTAASAYTSGNAVGGLITLSNAARVAAGSGLIQSAVINMKSAQTGQVDLVFFNANPTGSTCTDKTAFAVAAADFDKVLGVAHVTDWTSLGTPSSGQAQGLAMPFALASGSTLYACAVTRSTPTFAATTDVTLTVRILRN